MGLLATAATDAAIIADELAAALNPHTALLNPPLFWATPTLTRAVVALAALVFWAPSRELRRPTLIGAALLGLVHTISVAIVGGQHDPHTAGRGAAVRADA